MFPHKRALFGADIPPACAYCARGRAARAPGLILCPVQGVVAPRHSCRRFRYDPLRRVPRRQPPLPGFSAEDFSLE